MIKKLAELAKEEGVVFNYCIGPDNAMSITVFGKVRDFIIINPSSFSDDEIIEITKDVIRRANEWLEPIQIVINVRIKKVCKMANRPTEVVEHLDTGTLEWRVDDDQLDIVVSCINFYGELLVKRSVNIEQRR